MQKRHPSPRASSIRTLFSQIFPRNAPHLNSHPLFEPAGPHRQYLGCSSPHKLQRFLCLIDIELSVVCLGLLELDGHSSLFGTSRELTFHATMNISANFTPMKTLLNSDNWNPRHKPTRNVGEKMASSTVGSLQIRVTSLSFHSCKKVDPFCAVDISRK